MRARLLALAAAALVTTTAVVGAGCGSGPGSSKPDLVVSAAASLRRAFTDYGASFEPAKVRLSFGGSDMLAAQIEQGVKPDVYAAANTKLPQKLFHQGLVETPTVFATNRLVLAVPASSSKVSSLQDLGKPGVTLAVGAPSVPIGGYTRDVISRLPPALGAQILDNVRSEEPDVGGIIGKLTQGAVDAGFAYVTDVKGAGGKLKAIELPAAAQPSVAYAIAVVKGSNHAKQARDFIDGLVADAGQARLKAAGFGPPPAGS
jgi:molybdate transport system substrate-binding protein